MRLLLGDCLDKLKELDDNSVDSIVTDPPYGLSFMGSGSTGKAAMRGGFDFIGVEMDEEYMKIAESRIQYEIDNPYKEEKGKRTKINKNANKFF